MRELVLLRYQLLWATARTSRGRIVLFGTGILLISSFAALILYTGFATGRSVFLGQAQRAVPGALSVLFLQSILVTNLLGVGMNVIFSEAELRRYPLTVFDRLLARHVIAILDPFWAVYLALYLGLAAGLAAVGASSLFPAVIAATLLLLCNYAAARIVDQAIQRVTAHQAGTEALLGVVAVSALGIAMAVGTKQASLEHMDTVYDLATYSPAFAAASAMTGGPPFVLLTLLIWLVVLIPSLVWLESNPPRAARRRTGEVAWDTFFERAGQRFGSTLGPLVTFWLRFQTRNIVGRRMLFAAIPLFSIITYAKYRDDQLDDPNGAFIAALGTLPLVAIFTTWRTAVNQFGYLGGGLRRLLLFPVPPSLLLRSCTYVCTIVSLLISTLCVTGWALFSPYSFDLRRIAMLACSAITGLCLFHSASVWVTVLKPRRGNYFMQIGNDSPLWGTLLAAVGSVCALVLPLIAYRTWPAGTSPETWWSLVPVTAVAVGLYFAMLGLAGWTLARRRERLLVVVEGKD
ncbi:MAG: hypothetical protein K2X00_19100 [Nitrospiraceae bacterium]|nr:hypothetical protein [Nitrospiraceae bacterium]